MTGAMPENPREFEKIKETHYVYLAMKRNGVGNESDPKKLNQITRLLVQIGHMLMFECSRYCLQIIFHFST